MEIPVKTLTLASKFKEGTNGFSFVLFEGDICLTVFENKEYQMFHTDKDNCIYDKAQNRVYRMSIDGWTKVVNDIEREIKFHSNKCIIN